MLNAVNFADDGRNPLDIHFQIRISKQDQHDAWYLPSAATKSVALVKVKNPKHLCFFTDYIFIIRIYQLIPIGTYLFAL